MLIINLVNQLLFIEVEIVLRSIEAILKEYVYCKEVMTKHFNKNLIMTEKEEESFRSSNICWISEKLIYRGENIEVLPLEL